MISSLVNESMKTKEAEVRWIEIIDSFYNPERAGEVIYR